MALFHHALTHVGTVRQHNEDAILSHPDAGVWVVADGMGGHQGGDFASQCIIRHMQAACDRYKGNYLVERIRHVLSEANREIYLHSQHMPGQPIIGSTVVVLALEADNFHCFWSGDSRCYLYRGGEFFQLTKDHSEAEAILAEQGSLEHLNDNERIRADNTLIHAIGVGEEQAFIEYASGYLYEDDNFYLCSDGINKVYTNDEIARWLQKNAPIETVNKEIVNTAVNTHAPDNLSSIIVEI